MEDIKSLQLKFDDASDDIIHIKDIMMENFQDYKKTSMFIATCGCTFKCLKELDMDISICQNCSIAKQPNISIKISRLVELYLNNHVTEAVVIGGLEPLLQFNELLSYISYLRRYTLDDIVIYTGYYKHEILQEVNILSQYKNIIIKFGRYIPNQKSIYDRILGVTLASNNQYAVKIS